jgi:hypothetical protein
MNFSNNPFGVLEDDDQSSDWCKVETRKQRRSRKNVIIPQIPKPDFLSKSKKSFTEQMLKEYSSKFQMSNIVQVCEAVLGEVDEGYLKNSANWELLKKRIVEEVGHLAQEALFSSLSVEKEEVLEDEEDEQDMVAESEEIEKPDDEEDNEEKSLLMREQDDEVMVKNSKSDTEKALEELGEDEEHKSEHDLVENVAEEELDENVVDEEPMPEEDVVEDDAEIQEENREPTPEKKTLAQTLAEQAKAYDPTVIDGVKFVVEWCNNIRQTGEEGEKYRAAFNQSTIFRTIVRWLVTTSPTQKIYGGEEIIELFHEILQGKHEYHRWLYNQITKLALIISKTASRTNIEWVTFLSNQTFALVDAQKKPAKGILHGDVPEIEYNLPSTYLMTDNDNRLKVQCDHSDSLCQEMCESLKKIRIKDEALMSMNPAASVGFKERYIQIQRHVQENISKVHAHMTAHTRQLTKIADNFKANELRTKELIQPIEDQLKGVKLSCEQTKNEILEYESRLKSARAKLLEQEALKKLLKDKITKAQAANHPEKADLIKLHNNYRFNLESVKRKEHCYTHLQYIASESHKHLDSWSSCNINQERDSRRVLLQHFYDSVEKYICTLFSMLNFLEQRVGFMNQTLRRSQSEYNQRKQFFGNSNSPLEKYIAADKEKINIDLTMIRRLQAEIQTVLQTSFDFAVKWGPIEQIFNDLWQKVQSMAIQYKINLSSFVKLKTSPIAASAHIADNSRTQRYSQKPHQVASQQDYAVPQAMSPLHQHHQARENTYEQQWRQNSHQTGSTHMVQSSRTGGHQTLLQDMQENKYQKHAQTAVQAASRGHPVPQAQTCNQQPLKIINNDTTKTYDLLQQNVRSHYQTQAPQNHTPVTVKGANHTAQTPHQGLGNNIQGYRRRARNNRRRRPPNNSKLSGGQAGTGWGNEFI